MKVIMDCKGDIIKFILSTPCPGFDKDKTEYGVSITRFTGNQLNPDWEWDNQSLWDLNIPTLKHIADDRKNETELIFEGEVCGNGNKI